MDNRFEGEEAVLTLDQDQPTYEETKQLGMVSIIIPAFDEEEGIIESVNGVRDVMAKSHYDYEIIVVDDGSTDKTSERVRSTGSRVSGTTRIAATAPA